MNANLGSIATRRIAERWPQIGLCTVSAIVSNPRGADVAREYFTRLGRAFEAVGTSDWEIIFVGDSDNETARELDSIAKADSRVRALHRSSRERHSGFNAAVLRGIDASRGESILVLDGDLRHPVEVAQKLLESLLSMDDGVVVASRYANPIPPNGFVEALRQAPSRSCRSVARLLLPEARLVTDPMSGLFAVKRSVVESADLRPFGYKILLEVLVRGRWARVSEIPYVEVRRRKVRSKTSLRAGVRLVRHICNLVSRRGRHPLPFRRAEPPMAGLRVLIVTSEAPPVVSGIARSVGLLEVGLVKAGHSVTVVSRADFPAWTRNEIRISAFGLFWPTVRRRLSHYDVVNLHGPAPTFSEVFLLLVWSAAKGDLLPPVVYTHHSDLNIPGFGRLCRLYNWFVARLAHRADTIIVTSKDYQALLSSAGSTSIRSIPWATHDGSRPVVEIKAAPDREALRVLFVGQFRPYKGIGVLLRAVSGLDGVHLSLVGDGPERRAMQTLASQLHLTTTEFLGRVSDAELWRLYGESDVIVLPSLTSAEAFGLVLLEGMTAGCVPVASNLNGVREVVGDDGLLFPPGDIEGLRSALMRLAEDRELLARLSVRGRGRNGAELFGSMITEYEDVFMDVVMHRLMVHSGLVTPDGWRTPEEFLHEVSEVLRSVTPSLTLFARSGQVRPHALWRVDNQPQRIYRAPIAERVARSGRSLLIDGQQSGSGISHLLVREDLTSSLLIPVKVSHSAVSVLSVSTTNRTLGEAELELVNELAPQTRRRALRRLAASARGGLGTRYSDGN